MPALGKIKHVIWHCSATPNGQPFTAADIHRWHKQRGWKGIGYHFVIGVRGELWSGRAIRYNEFESGAHTSGKNAESLGVCVIGGVDSNGDATYSPTGEWLSDEQIATIQAVHRFLSRLAPQAKHSGHRKWAAKECPCFDIDLIVNGSLSVEPAEPLYSARPAPKATESKYEADAPNFDDDGR